MNTQRVVVVQPMAGDDEVVAFNDIDTEDPETFARPTSGQMSDLLRRSLPQFRGQPPPQPEVADAAARLRAGLGKDETPYAYIRPAVSDGKGTALRDGDLLLAAIAAFIDLPAGVGLPPSDEGRLKHLAPADWLGAILGVVRLGVGSPAGPADLVRAIDECPEVDGAIPADQRDAVEDAFELVLTVWEAAGAVDRDRRLNKVGVWALPRALALAWHDRFDP